ncbi:hypothetical protein J4233_06295 [Candidatus Pacearchaeota archaeon]|nr:hypothetical protein [Candidatus Pacearchaeota archaeon]
MPSDRQIKFTLKQEDFDLFNKALEKYVMNKSKLLQEIVHAWLFSNKLKLIENGNKKRR